MMWIFFFLVLPLLVVVVTFTVTNKNNNSNHLCHHHHHNVCSFRNRMYLVPTPQQQLHQFFVEALATTTTTMVGPFRTIVCRSYNGCTRRYRLKQQQLFFLQQQQSSSSFSISSDDSFDHHHLSDNTYSNQTLVPIPFLQKQKKKKVIGYETNRRETILKLISTATATTATTSSIIPIWAITTTSSSATATTTTTEMNRNTISNTNKKNGFIENISFLPTSTTSTARNVEEEKDLDTDTSTRTGVVDTIVIPLQYIESLSAYVVYYYIGGDRFGAIIDTGSPFLMIPDTTTRRKSSSSLSSSSVCTEQWGCYNPQSSSPSSLSNTIERYDNNEGLVQWRISLFAFDLNKQQQQDEEEEEVPNVANDNNMNDFPIPPLRMTNMTPLPMVIFTFGVLSQSLLSGSGGIFFGLIRNTNQEIRPSFLGQTNIKSLQLCFQQEQQEQQQQPKQLELEQQIVSTTTTNTVTTDHNRNDEKIKVLFYQQQQPTLVLSTKKKLIDDTIRDDYIKLVDDLNRLYGDPVVHYAAIAESVRINNTTLFSSNQHNNKFTASSSSTTSSSLLLPPKPIYVIFDTGVTGMVVSRDIYDARYVSARQNREKNLWNHIQINFALPQPNTSSLSKSKQQQYDWMNKKENMKNDTEDRQKRRIISLEAYKPITTPLGQKPWPKFQNAYLIVIGLAFLKDHTITIEMDEKRLWID